MPNDAPDISKNNEEILLNIQLLQQSEQDLMNDLENNPNLSSTQQQKIIANIQKLTDIRSGLYTTLSGMNSFYQSALGTSTGTLDQQTAAINIVETELNRSKRRLEYLENEKNNKIRLVEINEYYGDKYAEHTTLMKIIIFTLVPIIILTIIYNRGFLPSRVYYILFIIVGIIGSIYFWQTYTSIIARDNMNYDEYLWSFNPKSAPKGNPSDKDPWEINGSMGVCVGEACCQPDQTYDTTLDQCISKTSCAVGGSAAAGAAFGGGPGEAFTMPTLDDLYNGLAKTQPGKYKADVDLKENFSAYNSTHF